MYSTAWTILRVAALVALLFSGATAWDYYGPAATFCQAGAGCGDVHAWSTRVGLDRVLPAFGLTFYGALLGASLLPSPQVRRLTALAAAAGGAGAVAFILLQKLVIGAWCWLCLGVDSAAIVAAAAGAALGRAPAGHDPSARQPRAWAAAALLAAGLPFVWGATTPSNDVPNAVRALYDDGNTSVVVMSDPECPYCRLLHTALDAAVTQASAAGARVSVRYVLVPLPFHTYARDASRAVLCAQDQGQGDPMRHHVYTSDALAREALVAHAASLGLSPEAFVACLDDPATEARIVANEQLADAAGMQGLPTTFVGDHTLVGFDARRGAEPYVDAILAASRQHGPARPLFPLLLTAALALAIPFGLPWQLLRRRR